MLVTSNAEDTKKNVETFSNLLNKIVQSNVERALRQDSPVSTQSNKMTKIIKKIISNSFYDCKSYL